MNQSDYLRGKGDAYKEVADSFMDTLRTTTHPAIEAFLIQLVNGYTDLANSFHAAANRPRLVKPDEN